MSLITFSFLLGINGQCGSGVALAVLRGTEQQTRGEDRWGESETDRD